VSADQPETAELSLQPTPEAPGEARRFVRTVLFAWGRRSAIDSAQLLVSELVTNAVMHGGGHLVGLRISNLDGGLRVEVDDDAPTELPQLHPVDDAPARGLHIVDALSSAWGCSPDGDRKTVWCELEVR
jgi:anti-sigma regulatory factor (Ser/Thr protein kinase)